MSEPLYRRDGSRFVLYDAGRQHTPPIPVPRQVAEWDPEAQPTPTEPVVRVSENGYRVYAPRCPHGRFRGCTRRGCPGPS